MTVVPDRLLAKIEYPSEDGELMAESDFQRKPLTYAVETLDVYFQEHSDVYVSGNLFIYYEEDNPEAVVAPDVFVVFGVEKRQRSSYMLWLEGSKAPNFVLEILSKSTRSKDLGPKRGTYAFLGVSEYFLYDPTGEAMNSPLKGLRLVRENYEQIPFNTLPDGSLSVQSQVLGLELRVESRQLHFYNPTTSKKLLNLQEAEQALHEAKLALHEAEQSLREAQARADAEAVARQAAEARIAELEAQLRFGKQPPKDLQM